MLLGLLYLSFAVSLAYPLELSVYEAIYGANSDDTSFPTLILHTWSSHLITLISVSGKMLDAKDECSLHVVFLNLRFFALLLFSRIFIVDSS